MIAGRMPAIGGREGVDLPQGVVHPFAEGGNTMWAAIARASRTPGGRLLRRSAPTVFRELISRTWYNVLY
jgi:hypothetical protein